MVTPNQTKLRLIDDNDPPKSVLEVDKSAEGISILMSDGSGHNITVQLKRPDKIKDLAQILSLWVVTKR